MVQTSAHITLPFDLPGGEAYAMAVHTWGNANNPAVICLHGFMQTGASWNTVAKTLSTKFYVLAPDLIGHGKTTVPLHPDNFTFTALTNQLDVLVDYCDSVAYLVGYSMGGRLAATYTVAHLAKVCGLVLESAGLGPATQTEREQRAEKVAKTEARLQTGTLQDFVDFWEQLPLFASQKALPAATKQAMRKERLANNPQALALITQYAGQHRMDNLREPLVTAGVPVLYLAGELDAAYTEVARSLAAECANHKPNNTALHTAIVPGVGHNIHAENPDGASTYIADFLSAL